MTGRARKGGLRNGAAGGVWFCREARDPEETGAAEPDVAEDAGSGLALEERGAVRREGV